MKQDGTAKVSYFLEHRILRHRGEGFWSIPETIMDVTHAIAMKTRQFNFALVGEVVGMFATAILLVFGAVHRKNPTGRLRAKYKSPQPQVTFCLLRIDSVGQISTRRDSGACGAPDQGAPLSLSTRSTEHRSKPSAMVLSRLLFVHLAGVSDATSHLVRGSHREQDLNRLVAEKDEASPKSRDQGVKSGPSNQERTERNGVSGSQDEQRRARCEGGAGVGTTHLAWM
ncbi:hypothetical protein BD779DRAFT_1787405 [Infundibulicybe gibba]|nr:hypothetical protein BD779DRAFT_1787405 [Infundibulicybe gibba]